MAELWYRLEQLPDLTLNKYASLEERGVDGVLEMHIAFLRQMNRKGIMSGLSYHLYYLYVMPEDRSKDMPGHRLQIHLMVRGSAEALENVPALIKASPLSPFFKLESSYGKGNDAPDSCSIKNVLDAKGLEYPSFSSCAFLTKTETLLPAAIGEGDDYYMLREWEMNESGRLYNMCKMMEALGQTALFRIDLYPVERSVSLREALRKPMSILRSRQDDRSSSQRKDYEGKDVLKSYEDLIEQYDSSPHFIANIMVFANGKENAVAILDAAGSESLLKGKYNISTFNSTFDPQSFLYGEFDGFENMRERMIVKKGRPGLIICMEETSSYNLNYLPTLFTLEEIAPFFRLPALYDGEVIQIAKETAPAAVKKEGALFLGTDTNGYDVYFPLSLLPKHAFIAGVPGSGKTNTMHHITSTLWKEHGIPFLALEPAKQEYRALLNDPGMKDMYLFSPNADMSFPLHINPFEMPKGIMVAEHIRRLCSVFEGAFPLDNPMPFLLDTAIEAVYRENGWIPEHVYTGDEKEEGTGKKRPLPTMSMLYSRLEQELRSTQYSDEVRGNLESALKVRIGSLLRREMGDVFDVPESTLEPEKWLEVPAVIELESMGTGPANFLTLMLCSLIRETLKVNPQYDGDVRHVIFIEEAHNLIGPESEEQSGADADPKIAATAFIVKMLAEVRALKEGIVIADQLPTVMAQEVLKNTGLKIGMKITSADDRSLLGSTMAASGLQLEQMATFAIGQALIFYEKLQRPFIMRIKEWWGELEDKTEKDNMKTSKNDEKLREFLKGTRTYMEENQTSVDIILEKYRYKLSALESRMLDSERAFKATASALSHINDQYGTLLDAALGKIEISEDKLQAKYDEFLPLLNREVNWFKKGKAKIHEPAEIAGLLYDQAQSLDRLRRVRWSRFGLEKDQQEAITKALTEILKKANKLIKQYDALAMPIISMGKCKSEDLRHELVNAIRKTGIEEAAANTAAFAEKINRIVKTNMQENA